MVTKSETLGTPNDAVNEQIMDDMSTINLPNERKRRKCPHRHIIFPQSRNVHTRSYCKARRSIMADTDDTEHSKKWDPLRVRLMFVYLKCHYREDKVNY